MRGEFLPVWQQTWHYIWRKLARHENAPADLFSELYRELTSALKANFDAQRLADIVDDPKSSQEALLRTTSDHLKGERALVEFLERTHDICEDLGGDALSNRYFGLLERFTDRFSLRYDLRRPCTLCPTIQGIFASLMRDLKTATVRDAHLNSLMRDYQDAVRDLRSDSSDSRIRTCIVKQINLLEAMGSRYPGVTANTIGQICDQIGTWPHDSVKDAMKNLYKFTNSYPGIRHGGTPATAIRLIEMRDMVAVSVLLAGFMPYLTDELNAELMYRGT